MCLLYAYVCICIHVWTHIHTDTCDVQVFAQEGESLDAFHARYVAAVQVCVCGWFVCMHAYVYTNMYMDTHVNMY